MTSQITRDIRWREARGEVGELDFAATGKRSPGGDRGVPTSPC